MQAIEWITRATRYLTRTWPHVFALVLAAVVSSTPVQADVELGIEEIGEKAIRAETPDAEPLRVKLEPVKASFKVDEPIRFNIRGNKPFFLYIYSVDKETDAVTLLFPTKKGQRHNKYPANRTLAVPNKGEIELLADEPGRESLLMVASTKYLPVKSKWYRKGADYYVGKTADFEKEFADKGIRVRGPDKTRDDKVLVKTVMVRIDGAQPGRGDSPSAATNHVWLTTRGNQQDYAIGDPIEAVFGSGQDGWIHLYVMEPNGRYNRLKSYAVKENRTYTAKAMASDPAGKHALVAVYSEDDGPAQAPSDSGVKALSLLDADASPKGVELVEDKPKPMAVYRFRISDE